MIRLSFANHQRRTFSSTAGYRTTGIGRGNASGALLSGGLRHAELHPSRRALPRLATRPDAGHQEARGRTGRPVVPPGAKPHAPDRTWPHSAEDRAVARSNPAPGTLILIFQNTILHNL